MRHRHHKTDREKKFRKVWQEYRDAMDLRKDHGHWVKVEPYQRGWTRTFDLRADIKNRDDAGHIRQVLKLINNQIYCRNRDFMHYDWRVKKDVPIEQKLRNLTPEQYETLTEKVKSYFVKREVIDICRWPYYTRRLVTRYEVKNDFWFVFLIEPYVVEYHWVPNPEWESRYAEISNRIERNNWWPKIGKACGWDNNHQDYGKRSVWMKNKYGEVWEEEE